MFWVFFLPGCADASGEGRAPPLDPAVRALVLGGERRVHQGRHSELGQQVHLTPRGFAA